VDWEGGGSSRSACYKACARLQARGEEVMTEELAAAQHSKQSGRGGCRNTLL
jgi:hypothetical protein